MVVAPTHSVQMDLAQKGLAHKEFVPTLLALGGLVYRDLVRRGSAHMQMVDPDFSPQHPTCWQLALQVPRIDNFGRGWPVVADNFGKGKIDFSPGVAGSHMPAGHQTELDTRAAPGKKVGTEAHLVFDNPFESGAQYIVLGSVELRRPGRKIDLVGFEVDLVG